jgi:hypothetical protein
MQKGRKIKRVIPSSAQQSSFSLLALPLLPGILVKSSSPPLLPQTRSGDLPIEPMEALLVAVSFLRRHLHVESFVLSAQDTSLSPIELQRWLFVRFWNEYLERRRRRRRRGFGAKAEKARREKGDGGGQRWKHQSE